MNARGILYGIFVASFLMTFWTHRLLWAWIYSQLGRNRLPMGNPYSAAGVLGCVAVCIVYLKLGPSVEALWNYVVFGVSVWLGGIAGLFLYELVGRLVRRIKNGLRKLLYPLR